MKKLILTSIALALILTVNAQKIGFKVGLNLSGVSSDTELQDFQTDELLKGLSGGLAFEFCPDKIGVRAEALYTQKGYKVITETTLVDGTTDAVTDISLNIDYIEVPVLFKLKLGPAYILAGPYFAYAMSGKEITSITVDGQKLAEELYAGENTIPSNDVYEVGEFNGDDITFKKTDFGANVAVGAEFLMFFAEARYGVGLSNIQDYESMPDDAFTKNYTITFSLGMLFGK